MFKQCKRWKKSVTIMVAAAVFIFTLLPGFSGAGAANMPKISLEEAIIIAKKHFEIGDGYDVFRSSYEEWDARKTWRLSWYDQSGALGEVAVGVNGETGEIVNYHAYNPREDEHPLAQGYLPKLSREEAKLIALAHFARLTDKKPEDIEELPRVNEDILLRKGTKYYEFNFAGLVNGVVFPENKIIITINGDTGELRAFTYNWEYWAGFPNGRNVSLEESVDLIKGELEIELAYFRGYSPGYGRGEAKPVQLVYQVKNANQILIDAATGKPLEQREYGYSYDQAEGKGSAKEMQAERAAISPQEQKELDNMAGLLSKDEALAIATGKFPVPGDYIQEQAGLNRDWEFPELFIWNFSWRLESKEKYGHLGVEVDANTGQIIGFNSYEYDNRKEPVESVKQEDYRFKGREEALIFAESYIEANYAGIKDSLRLEIDRKGKQPFEEHGLQSSYWFRFTRLVDGIPFDKNFLSLTVDAASGKISSMNLRWVELDFPAVKNIIDLERIAADFLADNEVRLEYSRQFDYELGRQGEIYLVYRIPYVKATLIDAQTGDKLNYNGEVVKEKSQVEFTDIQGHWAEADILLLSRNNLFDFAGGEFKPDQFITQGELVKILVRLNNPWLGEPDLPVAYQHAAGSGLVKEGENDPDSPVFREELAMLLVRFLGHEEVSKLDIYKLEFADSDRIAKDKRGSVAIAAGFGLLTGDYLGNLRPQHETTRAEAAVVLARLLRK